jgi:hypothetical protein
VGVGVGVAVGVGVFLGALLLRMSGKNTVARALGDLVLVGFATRTGWLRADSVWSIRGV